MIEQLLVILSVIIALAGAALVVGLVATILYLIYIALFG